MPSTSLSQAIPAWLDTATRALLEDLVVTLRQQYATTRAVMLYGSVARHDERPLNDAHPSDVDVLIVFDTDDENIAVHQGEALFHILGRVYDRHLDAPRDVKVMFASRTLREWDSAFIANVARDGIVLWSEGPLPTALALSRDQHGSPTAPGDHTWTPL